MQLPFLKPVLMIEKNCKSYSYHDVKGIVKQFFTFKKSELHGPKWYQCLW